MTDATLKAPADESHPVVAACADQRAQPPAPFTIAQAISDARLMRKVPECIVSDAQAKRVIDTLLAALESNPRFLNAVLRDKRAFCLIEDDRAAPFGIRAWAEVAGKHGCRPEKVAQAEAMATQWEGDPDRAWPE